MRAFHDGNNLKIITNEEATCVFNDKEAIGCGYDLADGIDMYSIDGKEHSREWNTLLTYYIKCSDDYGNQPNPDQCSIIAKPFNI